MTAKCRGRPPGTGKGRGRSVHVTARPGVVARWERVASLYGQTVQDLIREQMKEYCDSVDLGVDGKED